MRKFKKNGGMTIVEFMVVVVVIGLLVAYVAVEIGKSKARVRDSKRIFDLREIKDALEAYSGDNKHYPVTGSPEEGYFWYTACDSGYKNWEKTGKDNWIPELLAKKYLEKMPLDPKRKESIAPMKHFSDSNPDSQKSTFCYIYRSDGKDYKVAAHCAMERDPIYEGNPFYKGANTWFCGPYSIALYTPGAYKW